MSADRLRLLGHPVHPKFEDVSQTKAELRKSLLDVALASASEGRMTLLELEKNHKHRREWVWARLNLAPLSCFHAALRTSNRAASISVAISASMN